MVLRLTETDNAAYRQTMARFATGVAVVTAKDKGGAPQGITVSSVTSVSLAPPLVLYCLGKGAFHRDAFLEARNFAINVLSRVQQELAMRFAREAPADWQGIALERGAGDTPFIAESLAVLLCERAALHEAGDHWIVVGQVTSLGSREDRGPLIYYGSAFQQLAD